MLSSELHYSTICTHHSHHNYPWIVKRATLAWDCSLEWFRQIPESSLYCVSIRSACSSLVGNNIPTIPFRCTCIYIPSTEAPSDISAVSLYTNIPHILELEAVNNWGESYKRKIDERFGTDIIIDAPKIILEENTFNFDRQTSKQTKEN